MSLSMMLARFNSNTDSCSNPSTGPPLSHRSVSSSFVRRLAFGIWHWSTAIVTACGLCIGFRLVPLPISSTSTDTFASTATPWRLFPAEYSKQLSRQNPMCPSAVVDVHHWVFHILAGNGFLLGVSSVLLLCQDVGSARWLSRWCCEDKYHKITFSSKARLLQNYGHN